MKNQWVMTASAAASSFALALSTAAAEEENRAQEAERGFVLASAAGYAYDEIVVTGEYREIEAASATKTPTPIIDIPQSLSIISREQLDDQALLNLADVLLFTPGVSVGQGEGHRDQITIRGQNTTADFFVDGLRDDVQYFRPLYNLQRVEILRGSNALIFGRGGGGGVINRVTKTPDLGENFIEGTASVDTLGSAYVSADVNSAIGDAAGVRLNAFYERLDNHRDFFDGDRFGINPTAKAELGPRTTVALSYEYLNDDRIVDRGVPSLNGAPLEGFDNTFFGDPDANETTFEAHVARARLDHEFSDALSFNTTIQYGDYDKLYQNLFPVGFDDVGPTVSLDGYRDTTDRQNLIIQSNLVAEIDTGPVAHTWLFGAEYGDQDTENARRDVLFADSNDDQITFPFSDPLAIPAFSFPAFNRDRASEVDFVSVYLQDQAAIGDHIIIVGGVRYDRFEIDVLDRIEVANGAADGNDGSLSRVDEEFSPRVGVIVKPRQNVSVYASYSKSFLPRSGDQFLTLTLSDEALGPEEFENLEVGVKWDLTDALSLTAALFRLDRESGTTVDPNNVDNTILIGSRTEGLEAQLVGEILPNWRVIAGYSYLDANQRGNIENGVFANNRLAQVPEHMFSIWNRYDVSDRFGLGLGVAHQSAQFASISNAVELDGFTRVDAAAYYQVTDKIELQVNIENLLNSDFFPAAHNDDNISTAEPINARFAVSGRF